MVWRSIGAIDHSQTFITDPEVDNTFSSAMASPSTTAKRRRLNVPTELSDLNDDCLIHLARFLPLTELNAVNATCRRFYGIVAKNNLHKHHPTVTHFDIEALVKRYATEEGSREHPVECVQGYLERFGSIIEHIDFYIEFRTEPEDRKLTNDIFAFIVVNCSSALKSLRMFDIVLHSDAIAKGHLMFANLTTLVTDNQSNWPQIFPLCENLNDLGLHIDNWDSSFNLDYTFPKLRHFHIFFVEQADVDDVGAQENDTDENTAAVEHNNEHNVSDTGMVWLANELSLFLQRHVDLTLLSLKLPRGISTGIIGRLANLEQLCLNGKLHDEPLNPESLCHLSKLHKFEIINYMDLDYAPFLRRSAAAQTLVHLTLDDCTFDAAFFHGLSRFRRLRSLTLSQNLDFPNEHVPDAVWRQFHQFNDLVELHFYDVCQEVGEQFVRHLTGTYRSLQILTLFGHRWTMNDDLVAVIAKFEGLQQLKCLMAMVGAIDWQPFGRLGELQLLLLHNTARDDSGSIEELVMNNLDLIDTLDSVHIHYIRRK